MIENGTVYTPSRVITDGAVLVGGQIIQAVGKRNELIAPSEVRHLDAADGPIVPGFVNMHVHGMNGHDALDGDVEGLQTMSVAYG